MSLSGTVILLCLFAPKLYIVLFNPSKNIHKKFKTTVTSQLPKNNIHLNTIIATTVANRQRRLTPSDYTTEVTFCNSRCDWGNLNTSDQILQTDYGKIPTINGACSELKSDETTDLLAPSKIKSNANSTQQLSTRNSTSNLVLASNSENPWKKMSNVRYKVDGESMNETNSSRCHQAYAQHITFV